MTLMMTMVTIVAYTLVVVAAKWEWKDSAHVGAAGPRSAMANLLAHIHITKC
jgi:hypothetical protein